MGLFDKIFGKSVANQITPESHLKYNELLNDCIKEIADKNKQLQEQYGVGEYDRWDINQEVGDLVFLDDGIEKFICKVDILGSYSDVSGTWMWGWANKSLLEPLTIETLKVKQYGEKHQLEDLYSSKVEATETEAWAFGALANRILGGKGLYKGPTGNGFIIMMIKELKRTS